VAVLILVFTFVFPFLAYKWINFQHEEKMKQLQQREEIIQALKNGTLPKGVVIILGKNGTFMELRIP